MSFSIVKKSLELFKDDDNIDKSSKRKKKPVSAIQSPVVSAKLKKKQRRLMKKKLEGAKQHSVTAFDERHKFDVKDCTSTNVQFMHDISCLKVSDEKTVNKIVEYQAGRLAKNRPKPPAAVKQKGSAFTDKDFDIFEKEYAFWLQPDCLVLIHGLYSDPSEH